MQGGTQPGVHVHPGRGGLAKGIINRIGGHANQAGRLIHQREQAIQLRHHVGRGQLLGHLQGGAQPGVHVHPSRGGLAEGVINRVSSDADQAGSLLQQSGQRVYRLLQSVNAIEQPREGGRGLRIIQTLL